MNFNLNPPSHFNKHNIDLLSPDSFNKSKSKFNHSKPKSNSNNCIIPLFERIDSDKADKIIHLSNENYHLKELNENLQREIFNLLKSHQENIQVIRKECDKRDNELENNIIKLSQNLLEATEINSKKEIDIKLKEGKILQLESELKILSNKYEYECCQHTEKICQLEKDYMLLKDNLDQTKRYLSNAENELSAYSDTKFIIQTLENKIKALSDTNNSINNEMILLNLKLKSILEVTLVQEKLIASVSPESKQSALLTRWRQKVFELLIQIKSQNLQFINEKQHWNQQEKLFVRDVETLNLRVKYLEACLDQQKIETAIHQQKIQSLNDEIKNLKEQLHVKDNMNKELNVNFKNITESLEKISKLEFFNNIFSKLNLTNNKLKFTTQRINLLQAQFAERDSYIISSYIKSKNNLQFANASVQSEEDTFFNMELERAINERDTLALQLTEQSKKIPTLITEAVSKSKEECVQMNNEMKLKDQIIENLKNENNELKDEWKKAEKQFNQFKNLSQNLPVHISHEHIKNVDEINTVDLLDIVQEMKVLTDIILTRKNISSL